MVSIEDIVIKIKSDISELKTGMAQTRAELESIQEKTKDMGVNNKNVITMMREDLHKLHTGWRDVMMAVGMVSGAVGVAVLAVNALGPAFSAARDEATSSLQAMKDQINDFKREMKEMQGQGKTFEQQRAIIEAKYAPGSKEYKEAMLGLQEKMATEAYTKYGQTTGLKELTAIEAQRKLVGQKPASLDEIKYATEHGLPTEGFLPKPDTYEYGVSPAYQSGILANIFKHPNLLGGPQNFGGGPIMPEYTPRVHPETLEGPLKPSMDGLKKSIDDNSKAIQDIARQPRTMQVNITVKSSDDAANLMKQIAIGNATGLNQSNFRMR